MHYNKIGYSIKNIDELIRIINIKGVDLVELKPDKFRRDGVHLYFFDGEKFIINNFVAKNIKEMCDEKKVTVQIHLPYENKNDPSEERGLCQAVESHHRLLLDRYDMFGRLYREYGLGTILTTHPPIFGYNGKEFCSEEEALKVGREFYAELDRLIKEKQYGFKVGIENMVAPKKEIGTKNIGYVPRHIDKLIGRTSEIGITIDSGHRVLNNEMSISRLFAYGEILNCHFHSNHGKISEKNYDDDEHIFATPDNLKHYKRYITGLRRRGIPIVLEISDLEKCGGAYLRNYVLNLRKEITEGIIS